MQTRKNLLSLLLLIVPIAALAAEPILTASTETHSPDERIPAEEIVEAMKQQYKLDDPVAFYFDYLGKASGVSLNSRWASSKKKTRRGFSGSPTSGICSNSSDSSHSRKAA